MGRLKVILCDTHAGTATDDIGISACAAARVGSCAGSCSLVHLIDGSPLPPWLNNAPQDRRGPLRQEDHAAIGVHEKLDPVAGL